MASHIRRCPNSSGVRFRPRRSAAAEAAALRRIFYPDTVGHRRHRGSATCDGVLSFSDGHIVAAEVQAVTEVAADTYYEITVGGHVLRLTSEHPVASGPGIFRTASSLRPGDRVFVAGENAVVEGVVASIRCVPAKEPAYNLLVSPGGTYLANGIVVHNKGASCQKR